METLKTPSGLVVPAAHLNGTSKESLCNAFEKSAEAVNKARDVLLDNPPHPRDFYIMQENNAYDLARAQHDARCRKLSEIYVELCALWEAVDAQ